MEVQQRSAGGGLHTKLTTGDESTTMVNSAHGADRDSQSSGDEEGSMEAGSIKRRRRKGDKESRTRVEKRIGGVTPACLYMLLVFVVCLGVLLGVAIYVAVRISGCWPCIAYSPDVVPYLAIDGPMAMIAGPSRAAVADTESCEIVNGSFYDSIIVAGRSADQEFGFVKLLNGPGTVAGEVMIVSAIDNVLLNPDSLAMDYCDGDIFVADSHDGGIFHLSCTDEDVTFQTEVCGEYQLTFLEFDHTPLSLGVVPECAQQAEATYLFVGGAERDEFTGEPLNTSFIERIKVQEDEEDATLDAASTVKVKMLPDSSLPTNTPELGLPQDIVLSVDRGTILVANTENDNLLEITCACSCIDFANASSAQVQSVQVLASLRRPRALSMITSLNPAVYSRVYVAGGDDGAGYIAYYDFVDSQLHYVTRGLVRPVSIFEDPQRPNATGKSTVASMRAEGSVSGLYFADTLDNSLGRLECTGVVADFVETIF